MHPFHANAYVALDESAFEAAFRSAAGEFVAVGETGLDGRFAETLPQQTRLFALHLRLALREGLPVIIHAVRAHQRVLDMVADASGCRGVIHGFSGSIELAMQYVRKGFSLGVGGIVTHPAALKTHRALAAVPVESLVLETDAPAMAPAGIQGRNTPSSIPAILKALASLRDQPEKELAEICWHNSLALFPRIA